MFRVITYYSMICKQTLADWLLGYVSASYGPWVFDYAIKLLTLIPPSMLHVWALTRLLLPLAPLLHCLLLKQHPWSMATHKRRFLLPCTTTPFLMINTWLKHTGFQGEWSKNISFAWINTRLNTHVFKGNDQRISHLHGLL